MSKRHRQKPNTGISHSNSSSENRSLKIGGNPGLREIRAVVEMFETGQYQEAARIAQLITLRFPQHEFGWKALGAALRSMGRPADAISPLQKLAALSPDNPAAHTDLGTIYQELGMYAEAAARHRRALEIKPDFAEAHNNLGNALKGQGKLNEAKTCYSRALKIRPDFVDAHLNLGTLLQELRKLDEAEACYRQVLRIQPDDADAHHNLALVLLTAGRLEEGWQEYEFRWGSASSKTARPKTNLPQWTGQESLPGDRLLVFEEQGWGDKLQFSRYLPLAANRFPGGVTVIVGPAMHRLFSRSFPSVEFLEESPTNQSHWNWQCPLMSLPLALGSNLASIPSQVPYLKADSEQMKYWNSRIASLSLASSTRKIGIVWKSGAVMKIASLKSITFERLLPLFEKPGYTWFSLQKERDPASASVATAGTFIDWAGEFESFDDTASLIMNLDLVVSVDTSVAHLSGALGKPTWLLNRYSSDWRWMHNREDSPWYPTVRIFTQRSPSNWDEVLMRVSDTLSKCY